MSFIGDLLNFCGRVLRIPRNAEAEVEKRAGGRENLDWPESVVDLLKAVGRPSDITYRRKLAAELGRPAYDGTAEQNIWLHGEIMKKIRSREW